MDSDPKSVSQEIDSTVKSSLFLKCYAAPKRFDLMALFVVSSGFGLLFACLRVSGASPKWVGLIGANFGVIIFSQAFLFGGKFPRAASVLTSVTYWCIVAMVACFQQRDWVYAYLFVALPGAGLLGCVSGYVLGALAAGHFLVADYFRQGAKALRNRKTTKKYQNDRERDGPVRSSPFE